MSKDAGGKSADKRLGRMTVFRGLAGEEAIEATAAAIDEAGEADADGGAPAASDSDKGARKARASDADGAPPRRGTDADKGPKRPRASDAD